MTHCPTLFVTIKSYPSRGSYSRSGCNSNHKTEGVKKRRAITGNEWDVLMIGEMCRSIDCEGNGKTHIKTQQTIIMLSMCTVHVYSRSHDCELKALLLFATDVTTIGGPLNRFSVRYMLCACCVIVLRNIEYHVRVCAK